MTQPTRKIADFQDFHWISDPPQTGLYKGKDPMLLPWLEQGFWLLMFLLMLSALWFPM